MRKKSPKMRQARRARIPALSVNFPARFGWQAAAIAVLTLMAYWNSLDGSFHFDDWALFSDPYVAGFGPGLGIFRLSQTRPLTYWTFHLNFLAGGAAPLGFHVVNVALHAANAILVLWLARRHLGPLAAFLAAGLFAVHPLQTEAVSYIFARSSLLATFFALLCVVLFAQGRLAWSAAAFGFSLLAKEEAVALPAFLVLYDFLFVAGGRLREVMRRTWYYAALLLLGLLAAARLFYVLATTADPGVGFRVKNISTLSYALTQPRVIWHYLRLLVLPFGQNLDYDFPLSTSLLHPLTTLVALAGLAGLIAGPVYLLRRGHEWAFWALGFFVLLSPSSSVVAQADVIFEHRTYLPMASLAIALGWLGGWLLARVPASEMRFGLAAALLGVLLAGTIARNEVWVSELALWSDVVSKSPNKGRPNIGLARGLSQEGRTVEARQALERGVRLSPENHELHTNLGVAYLQEGDAQAALDEFQRALGTGGPTPEAWNNLGAAFYRLRQLDRAAGAFRQALQRDDCFYNARLNLMMLLAETGRKAEALATGTVPGKCRLLPGQARDLAGFRDQVSRQ